MLEIIGSGFGRTGTSSLKLALRELGFSPCYHMDEVFSHVEHIPYWDAATTGALDDWSAIFAGYRAAIDWPTASFWRELAAVYPDARVIHTERPEDAWYTSFANTIQPVLKAELPNLPPGWFAMCARTITDRCFGGRAQDREAVLDAYRRNNAAVRAELPVGRLLVFDPADGWEPLCAFLDVAVPDAPYPKVNTTAEFQAALQAL